MSTPYCITVKNYRMGCNTHSREVPLKKKNKKKKVRDKNKKVKTGRNKKNYD